MAEWRVAKVMGQAYRLDEILIQFESAGDGTRDLTHFQSMRQPCAIIVAFVVDKNLRLVFKPAKGGRVYDSVPVALVTGPVAMLFLFVKTAARQTALPRVRREIFLSLFKVFSF